MSNLEELIDKYLELEENFDEEDEKTAEELHDLGHEIDHAVYNEEFTILYNNNTDNEEVVVLIVGEETEEFLIPVYTSEEKAAKAIEFFKGETDEDVEFLTDKAVGNAIIETYSEDEEFLGLVINDEFVIYSENVHDCCE